MQELPLSNCYVDSGVYQISDNAEKSEMLILHIFSMHNHVTMEKPVRKLLRSLCSCVFFFFFFLFPYFRSQLLNVNCFSCCLACSNPLVSKHVEISSVQLMYVIVYIVYIIYIITYYIMYI